MRISEFGGELAIIEFIARKYGGKPTDALVTGIGDDAALIQIANDKLLIVTTDLLIENTHFRRDIIDPYSLGWKSVAANISDIAAMGGKPTYTFVSIALDDVDVSFVEELYKGMYDCATAYGSVIAGGDTNVSKDRRAINITQLGEVAVGKQVLRSGAKPGDCILVTGTPGDSAAGLEMLFSYGKDKAKNLYSSLVEAHLKPKPRVAEAAAAAATGKLHSMMDISDGLAADLPKLCLASGIGAIVTVESLPISPALIEAADELGLDARRLALNGGEEYELLMTVAEADVDIVRKAIVDATGTPVTAIGRITADLEVLVEYANQATTILKGGWTHFGKAQE
ncbi:MAG: thiamine-phosphate kinase [Armatimonadota bacterium]|nr:thiamine-phosphate kinase [Armatimonadota bacterium]